MNMIRKPVERYRFALAHRPDPAEVGKLASAMGEATGMNRKTFVRAFTGEQIGEPFMAAYASLHPETAWHELFILVGPEIRSDTVTKATTSHHKAHKGERQSAAQLWDGYPTIPVDYDAARKAGINASPRPGSEKEATATVISWRLTKKVPAFGRVPDKIKDDLVPVVAWHPSGAIRVYPWVTIPEVWEHFAPVLQSRGVLLDRIRWVEGSEPDADLGRLLTARHYEVRPST